jgi:hypothetical protein
MALLDGPDSQRDLQARVDGPKLVVTDGAGYEVRINQAEDCKKACLEFLATLKKDAGRLKIMMNTTSHR